MMAVLLKLLAMCSVFCLSLGSHCQGATLSTWIVEGGCNDALVLVQGRVHVAGRQPQDIQERAEQVLRAVGPLELRERPTVADKEKLMTAQALLKSPSLLKLYSKRSAASGVGEAAHRAVQADEAVGSASKDASGGSVRAEARASSAIAAEADAVQGPKGRCSAADVKLMEAKGAGSRRGSFPALTATCGKKAYKLLDGGFVEGSFISCFTAEVGLTEPCSKCFAGAAAFGVKNCALKCMMSWCSEGCLACAQTYKDTELLRCVGERSPEAKAC